MKLFAYDTKIYREILSQSDCERLQRDLNSLSECTDTWFLRFNVAKCKSMHLGRQNTKHKYYTQGGTDQISVEQVTMEKDIGVTFDSELKFSEHIAICKKKANQKLGLIKRKFEYMDETMFSIL